MRERDQRYFDRIERELDEAFEVAETAKRRGGDPKPEVEIPTARDMAARVENILGIDGVAERVRELEGQMSREEAALELVTDFVEGEVGEYSTTAGKIEGATRTAVALLTEGVVAAPIEGIDRVEVNENDDGTEYAAVYYAGPIRSAGGTAQALSVLVADYARTLLDVDEFKPREEEVERYAEEVGLYDDETGLQYSPKDKETKFITEHCPIMLDGEATGDEEVSGYRDLERIDTNSPRGGMCLVLAEGIALKAPKIQRYTGNLEEVEWPWLQDLIDGTIDEDHEEEPDEAAGDDSEDDDPDATADTDERPSETDELEGDDPDGPPRVEPNEKFLRDLIAGRPVFTHPSAQGGFRLRYGRSRNLGLATAGVHPATMHLIDDFLAPGTQIKTELPGKAAGVVPVTSIEGPMVRLANGDVRRIDDAEEALTVRNGVERILDIGEYLVNYGEFIENNHPLVPGGYAPEWWIQEFEAAGGPRQALEDDPTVDLERPTVEEALRWAREYDAPLHPEYTYCWHDIDVDAFETLVDAVEAGEIVAGDGALSPAENDAGEGRSTDDRRWNDHGEFDEGDLVLDRTEAVRSALETVLLEHCQEEDRIVVPTWRPLVLSLGFDEELTRTWETLPRSAREWPNAMKAVNAVAPFEVRERAPTRVGNRMGRPEKSEERELSPAVHTLFPINEAGGSERDVSAATDYAETMADTPGELDVEVGVRHCPSCDVDTYEARCPECGDHVDPDYWCPECNQSLDPDESGRVFCDRCEIDGTCVETRTIDLKAKYREALDAVDERENAFDVLKGVKGLSSAIKTPEPIEKGILRAKHGVSAFKDGTVRYDMTDLPITAVKPSELDVTADQFRQLGYEEDVHGDPLRHDDQVVELNVQDVVLSDGAAEHMLKTADFIDDLLESYYGMEPYYDLDERDDLVGELVFGMAPHTSAAVVGRVIGFSSVAGGYAHPYFHAAKRRNCFHPETKIWYEDKRGNVHHERIESFVESRMEDPRTDDFGTLVENIDASVSVPSVDETGKQTMAAVDSISKHPAPDHLIRVETRSGRELTVTPEHSVVTAADTDLRKKQASELSVGDELPAPKRVPVDGSRLELDLLEEFLTIDSVPNQELMVNGIGEEWLKQLLDNAIDESGYLKPVADRLELSKSTVYNWVNRDSIPASILLNLYDRETVLERVPDDVQLSIKRDTATVQRRFEVDPDVAVLLGYYTAEGFVRKEPGEFYQTTICIPDNTARNHVVDTFERALSASAFEENEWKITVSSRLVACLFTDVLELGHSAETKQIPDSLLNAPQDHLRSFLSAYFSGDGSASADSIELRAHTVSGDLLSDLIAALKRFGITGKTYTETRQPSTGVVAEFYDEVPEFESHVLKITSEHAAAFADRVGFHLDRKQKTIENVIQSTELRSQRLLGDGGDLWLDEISSIEIVDSDIDHTYCLTVENTHTLLSNDLFVGQCDGDEDCVMLLLDGLLNFSKYYLPDKRGGRMDAPLVMSSRIDPSEIDDEAHNVDVVDEYPLELYEAGRELADPESVDVEIAEDTLGTDEEYSGFGHTHEVGDIATGPDLSAYKTLGSMMEKMDAQLELSRKLAAVDETDVAERVIEYHFLPDLIGNLRAFSRQEVRCLECGEKYRRMPLTGTCRAVTEDGGHCGGDVNLTVHEGSVNKYMDTAIEVAEEYGSRKYTKQRLEVLERALDRTFENDKNKASQLDDFM